MILPEVTIEELEKMLADGFEINQDIWEREGRPYIDPKQIEEYRIERTKAIKTKIEEFKKQRD